ncbi:MAG: hypothetical protein QGH40_09580 [bacterium]|nr:hypothetical protein [bacterium]
MSETCSDDSPLQLIMEVAVEPNNVSDEQMLAERIPEIQERTGVEEMITDAAYSGKTSEKACEEAGVTLVPTEIRGRKESDEKTPLRGLRFDDENKVIACPAGYISLTITATTRRLAGTLLISPLKRVDDARCWRCAVSGK